MFRLPHSAIPCLSVFPSRLIIYQPCAPLIDPLLAMDPRGMAVGQVRCRSKLGVRELIVDGWERRGTLLGRFRLPQTMSFAVMAVQIAPTRSLDSIIREFRPCGSQTVVVILLDSIRWTRLTAGIWHDHRWCFPDEIQVIGGASRNIRSDLRSFLDMDRSIFGLDQALDHGQSDSAGC